MNRLTELLRPHVQEITEAAKAGDKTAAEIIKLYKMHCDCPRDPAAPAFCEQAFRDWKSDQAKEARRAVR